MLIQTGVRQQGVGLLNRHWKNIICDIWGQDLKIEKVNECGHFHWRIYHLIEGDSVHINSNYKVTTVSLSPRESKGYWNSGEITSWVIWEALWKRQLLNGLKEQNLMGVGLQFQVKETVFHKGIGIAHFSLEKRPLLEK